MPARNAEAIWEMHHDVLKVHSDPGRWQSWDLLWQCIVSAGDVYEHEQVGTLPSYPGAAVQDGKSGAITQLQDFAAVKGDKRFQIKNTGELTNLMWQQWLCSAGCQPAPLSLCAPELKLFKMGLNLCLPLECFRLLT